MTQRGPAGLSPQLSPRPRTVSPAAAAQPAESATSSPHGAPNLEAIVKIAHEQGHSDVHLGVGEVPRYRARGEMQTTEWPATDLSTFQGWLREILSPQQIDTFFCEKEFDGSHAFPFVRIRINLLDSLRGPAMVLRLIPQTILTMEQLKLPEVLTELAGRPKGLILVTGPTGSGKSTTLAAMIDWINRNETRHILTIEDPVEFVHESKRSLIRHR
ncbi:twitching motility protein PilT [Synechococcus sp. A15-28]|nr:twitching motility protein PilT [Synechococcus sp. A15-28]